MSNEPQSTSPAVAPASDAHKKTAAAIAESDYDQAQLQTVKNGEAIATAAQDLTNAGLLQDEGMRGTAAEELLQAGQDWRTLSREALEATRGVETATGTGLDAANAIRATVDYLRSKCRLKITQNLTWTEPTRQALRDRYFVGEDIFANEATAGQSIQTILTHAADDNLPGITAAKLATYQTQLDNFTGKPQSQSAQQAIATRKRDERDAKFTQIMNLRHEIQHAADGAWPWSAPLTRAFRILFKLPIGRPFTG